MTLIDAGELRALDALAASWKRHREPARPIVFDVGANRGDYVTEVLARFSYPEPFIFGFEPQRSAFEVLQQRFDPLPPWLRLFRCGLSSAAGSAALHSTANEACVLATLTARDADTYDPGVKLAVRERVRLERLDKIAAGLDLPRVDLLKLDTEGHELEALRGAGDVLDKTAVIQFEFNACGIAQGVSLEDFWRLLAGRFTFFRLETDGTYRPVMDPAAEHDPAMPQRNYLCVHHERGWWFSWR